MSSRKEPKIDYRIKLLSGNNVVLVEAIGFESEIFIPEIHNGRINFQNIIPNRRCCSDALKAQLTSSFTARAASVRRKARAVSQNSAAQPTNENPNISPSRTWRLTAGDDPLNRSPLAFSTPAPAPSPSDSYTLKQQSKNKENISPHTRILTQKYPSFDETQKPQKPQPTQRKTRSSFPHMKSVRIQCDVTTLSRNCGDSGFNIPDVPTFTNLPSALSDRPQEGITAPPKRHTAVTPASATKWRKCLTPMRTYSRHVVPVPRLSSSSSVKKSRSIKKVPSATQGTKGTHKIEVRKRKLIIDPKVSISPFTLRMQQRSNSHLNGKAAAQAKSLKVSEVSKPTAFELLTGANRARAVATKLEQQFKRACINKASSTCPKYKLLCNIPPLDHSDRARERKQQAKDLKANLEMQSIMPPTSKITAAVMMERTANDAAQTSGQIMHSGRLHWPTECALKSATTHS